MKKTMSQISQKLQSVLTRLEEISKMNILTSKEEIVIRNLCKLFQIEAKVVCGLVYLDPTFQSAPISIQTFASYMVKQIKRVEEIQ